MPEQFDWDSAYHGDGTDPAFADPNVLGQIDGLQPGTALDLGCGAGGNAIALARRGWAVTAVDASATALASARIHAAAAGAEITFVQADASGWIPPTGYDLVVSNYALPEGNTGRRVLATAISALAPGGSLVVTEWEPSMARRWGFDPEDFISLEDLVTAAGGLEIERAETIQVEAHDHGHASDDNQRRQLMVTTPDWAAITVTARRPPTGA